MDPAPDAKESENTEEEFGSRYWNAPAPIGYAAAIDGFGSVAAPLLAGFTIALIGITVPLSHDSPVKYPGTAIAFLAISALLLLGAVQCSMWARQYAVTPNGILEWWPDSRAEKESDKEAARSRLDDLRLTQWRYATISATWLARARLTYDIGILALLLGVLVILIPKQWTPSRVVAASLFGVAFLIELYWVSSPTHRSWPLVKKIFPVPLDVPIAPPTYRGPLP